MRTQLISSVAEQYGTTSDELHDAIREMDTILDNFFTELEADGLWDKVIFVRKARKLTFEA